MGAARVNPVTGSLGRVQIPRLGRSATLHSLKPRLPGREALSSRSGLGPLGPASPHSPCLDYYFASAEKGAQTGRSLPSLSSCDALPVPSVR